MTQYFGDFAEDATVYIPFNTFSSDDPSASVTITNLADADIMVHKDGGLTQIATDGATVTIDFDSITGNHLVTIDTSVHADYSTGSDYMVRIEGTTVDGATINAWIGSFSIENRYEGNNISTANVNTEVSDVIKTDTYTLPGQEAPPATPTLEEAIMWLYKVMRNRTTQTATQWSLMADDESTVDAKATVSDDGTTAIKQEIVTGP